MNEKKTIQHFVLELSNLTGRMLIFHAVFSLVPYCFVVYWICHNLPGETLLRAITNVSIINFAAAYMLCANFAVLKFYESHFEILYPLRLFWRRASYHYYGISALHFHGGKYSRLNIHFEDDSEKRPAIWSILTDFKGGKECVERLSAFLRRKNIMVKHDHYEDI